MFGKFEEKDYQANDPNDQPADIENPLTQAANPNTRISQADILPTIPEYSNEFTPIYPLYIILLNIQIHVDINSGFRRTEIQDDG